MVEVSSSCKTSASVEEVWNVLIRPSRIPDWNVLHAGFIGDVPAELAKDTEYGERFKLMGMVIAIRWTVTVVEPQTVVEMVGIGPAGLSVTNRYESSGTEIGSRVTMRSRFSGGPADTAFAPIIEEIGQRAADQAVANLAELLR